MLRLPLVAVTGAECRVTKPVASPAAALYALAGEAADRSHSSRSEKHPGSAHNVIDSFSLGASESDLAIATEALGPRARPSHWIAARAEARQLVEWWSLGIDRVATLLMRTGRLNRDEVLQALRETYQDKPHYLEALAPLRRMPWAAEAR